MGSHPLNLGLRFLLEMAALFSLGRWGWLQSESWPRWLLALGLPLAGALVWGAFAVPGDPSRSGQAPVPVPGWLRLLLELALFAAATWALRQSGATRLAWALGGITSFHYLISYDRLAWLFSR